MSSLVTVEAIEAARKALAGIVRVTPLEPSRPLSTAVGGPVWLKCENLQRAGSFKVRGAYVRIARLTPQERDRGVVAASAGNHAQGVALAAGLLGTRATVFMPVGAPLPKAAATRAYGATVEFAGDTVDESLVAAQEFAERTGAVFIHPFDHEDVIAGQGTVGLEILEQCPDVRTIITGVGGGGLISGIAVAAKAANPAIKVIGVQAEGAAAVPASLRAGAPQRVPGRTIADGIAVGRPGDLTFAHVQALVDEVVTVSDEDITRAMVLLLERGKLVVEAAGAVGVAALLSGAVTDVPTPAVVVLSGGNIDPLLMVRVIERGLAAAGRYLRFTVRCPDRPGQLAALLALIAQEGANVDDVVHRRHDPKLRLGEVEVDLSVETRGAEHSDVLLTALRSAGYEITFDR